jgi:hypothetical protein
MHHVEAPARRRHPFVAHHHTDRIARRIAQRNIHHQSAAGNFRHLNRNHRQSAQDHRNANPVKQPAPAQRHIGQIQRIARGRIGQMELGEIMLERQRIAAKHQQRVIGLCLTVELVEAMRAEKKNLLQIGAFDRLLRLRAVMHDGRAATDTAKARLKARNHQILMRHKGLIDYGNHALPLAFGTNGPSAIGRSR